MLLAAGIYAAAPPAYLLFRARVAALRDILLWLALGALCAPLVISWVRRRVWRPLSELDVALARVAEGDLTAEVAVPADDEIGGLARHFNEMTRVLRERAEEEDRLAAAGELLAGVAHEVNTPLAAIAAHAENWIAQPSISDEQRAEVVQILRQTKRAAKLLHGLLHFVRAAEREVIPVNLNDVVREAMDLVSYRFGVEGIAVGGRLDPTLPPVSGDTIRLEQVVVNLLSNAIDALRAIPPPRHLTVDTWVENAMVSVAVADNGRGVAPEIAARLFRPFATTKGRRGTGLGLYISRQTAREAGGDLDLVPSTGGGARFVLSLPATAPAQAQAEGTPSASRVSPPPPYPPPPSPSPAPPLPGDTSQVAASLAGLRILIVEDDEAIRRPMARFLAWRGAEVLEARDGQEALSRLGQWPADVILADVRMPRMDGIELYHRLEDGRPDLAARVMFLSGDLFRLAESGDTPVGPERVLVKPVDLDELEQRVLAFARAVEGAMEHVGGSGPARDRVAPGRDHHCGRLPVATARRRLPALQHRHARHSQPLFRSVGPRTPAPLVCRVRLERHRAADAAHPEPDRGAAPAHSFVMMRAARS